MSVPAFPQDNIIALITNPEIGEDRNAENLLEVVDSINHNRAVDNVIVLGNITSNGKFDEFIWAQEILDGLIAPYFVVGGEKDYLLSEGRGSEISLLWGDDKSFISNGTNSIVCLKTIIPEYLNYNYIDVETLNWFEEKISTNKSSRIITFSYNPISSTENSFFFYEKIKNKKLFSLVSKSDNSANQKSEAEGFYLNRYDGWGYSILTIKSDTLFTENISKAVQKSKSQINKNVFTPAKFDVTNKTGEKFKIRNVLWTAGYNNSIVISSIFSDGKIFIGFRNGLIICVNKSGEEKWFYQTNGRIYSSLIAEGDLILAATNEGDLLSLNANTGSLVQVIGIGETITSELCVIDIKEDGRTSKSIIAGTANGNLYCYDLYTLEPLWINQSANNGTGNRIISSIAGTDNKVFFQDIEGTIYCVSAVNGLLLWLWEPIIKNTNPLFKTDIIIRDNNIYLIDGGGNFRCIDALLGTEKWNIRNIDATGLIEENKTTELSIATNKNEIITISTKLGKAVKKIGLSAETKSEIITDFLLIDDTIITGFSDGSVYQTKPKQKAKLIFKSSSASIVSLTNIEGKCLLTDYDGNLTLINFTDLK